MHALHAVVDGSAAKCARVMLVPFPFLQRATQVKLDAEFSVPGAPVNFGQAGHSHNGRVRPAVGPGLPSAAVRPVGALPFSTQSRNTPRLSNFALKRPKPWPNPGMT